MPRLRFPSLGREIEADPARTLLDACLDAGIPMEAACGGFAACNTCRVRVLGGSLGPPTPVEEPFLDRPDQRLGCQCQPVGDLVLELDPGDVVD